MNEIGSISKETRTRATSARRESSAPARRPVLLVIGPVPPPYIGPAVATGRLLRSEVIASEFEVVHLDTSDRDGMDDIGQLSLRNISIAFAHGWRCLRLLARHRPAAVYLPIDRALWGFIRDMQFMLAARLFGAKLLVHLRAGRFDLRHDFGWIGRTIARIGLGTANRAIVLGRSVSDVFGQMVAPDRIRIVHNGMDLEDCRYSDDELACRAGRPLRIVYLGNLYPGKGAHMMLQAMPKIVSEFPDATLVVAGRWLDQAFHDLCLKIVREGGVESNVEFVGGVDAEQKRDLLATATVLCFTPIEPEGLPWVVLEGMGASLPIVATSQGTIAEVVEHGKTGLIVPSNDPDSIAEAVLALARDESMRSEYGRRGRVRIETVYSELAAHQALVDVTLECIGTQTAKNVGR